MSDLSLTQPTSKSSKIFLRPKKNHNLTREDRANLHDILIDLAHRKFPKYPPNSSYCKPEVERLIRRDMRIRKPILSCFVKDIYHLQYDLGPDDPPYIKIFFHTLVEPRIVSRKRAIVILKEFINWGFLEEVPMTREFEAKSKAFPYWDEPPNELIYRRFNAWTERHEIINYLDFILLKVNWDNLLDNIVFDLAGLQSDLREEKGE